MTDKVSDEVLREGIRLSEAATERPWVHGYDCVPIANTGDHDNLIYIENNNRHFIDLWNPGIQDEKNLEYITHACNHFPAIAQELLEARQRLTEIDAASKADADDIEKMRDGTKLTRSGLVTIIKCQQQDIAERDDDLLALRAKVKELESRSHFCPSGTRIGGYDP